MKRRYVYFGLTLIFDAWIVYGSETFLAPMLASIIFLLVLIAGGRMMLYPDVPAAKLKELGWGMLYGSLMTIILLFCYLVFLWSKFMRIT